MNKMLKNVSAYVCINKITQRPMSGHDGHVESCLTRLKRGVRYGSSLNTLEGFYRALDEVGLLTVFQSRLEKSYALVPNLSQNLGYTLDWHRNRMKDSDDKAAKSTDQKVIKDAKEQAELHAQSVEVYRILMKVEDRAEQIVKDIAKNRSGNIEWKDLTFCQFFQYDAQTNSFVEISEKGGKLV